MDYKVILNDFFVSDLKEIVEYLTHQADAETASRVANAIVDRAIETGRNPHMGKPLKRQPDTRKVLCYSYLIYYDVNEEQHAVEILRAWHGARDPKTLRLK